LKRHARESLERYKQSSVGNSGGNLEQNTNMNLDSIHCARKISDGNENSVGKWTRDYSYFILGKHMSTFYPCPETLAVV
jgi:hypothetical protein